jgi:hypothetical protein
MRALAAEGARVMLTDINVDLGEPAAASIPRPVPRIRSRPADHRHPYRHR